MKVWQKIYDDGREPPSMFFRRPEVRPDLLPVYTAFHELTTERQSGMGVVHIPVSKIRQYGSEELGLGDDDNDWFFSVIRQMDDEFVTMHNSKTTPNRPTNEVAGDDVDGLKSFFGSLQSRAGQKGIGTKPTTKQ